MSNVWSKIFTLSSFTLTLQFGRHPVKNISYVATNHFLKKKVPMSPWKTFSGFTPVDVEMPSPTVVSHLQSSHQKNVQFCCHKPAGKCPAVSLKCCVQQWSLAAISSKIMIHVFFKFFFFTRTNPTSRGLMLAHFEKQSQTAHISTLFCHKLSGKWFHAYKYWIAVLNTSLAAVLSKTRM